MTVVPGAPRTAPAASAEPATLAGERDGYVRDGAMGLDVLTAQEWVLTNGLGGYAMGTASGVPTRRYHGLLVASLSPPVERVLALHSLVETVVIPRGMEAELTAALSNFRFRSGLVHPRGHEHLARFEKGEECRWVWRIGEGANAVEVTRSLTMADGANAVRVRYAVRSREMVRLTIRPLVAMRNHHLLIRASEDQGRLEVEGAGGGVQIRRSGRVLSLGTESARFAGDVQWWYDFAYEQDRERGFDFVEDLFSPGVFEAELGPGRSGEVTLNASVVSLPRDTGNRRARVASMAERALAGADVPAGERRRVERLAAAADEFVVRRVSRTAASGDDVSVIAGYPWFSDWGRDALIALPGLLLCTGRHEEARRVLVTFARNRRRGLIPNLFDDQTGEAEYNTADASLWFLRAACEYARVSGDGASLRAGSVLGDACREIIECYRAGTDFGIRMDPADGLIAAGDESSALTWMDAKRDGVVFTARHGKPVEINALWHHGLVALGSALDEPGRAAEYRSLADRAGASFRAAFWDAERGCLFDVLQPGAGGARAPSRQVRPNQVFAVSLPHSALSGAQKTAVVRVVRERLLTPHGLRTLDPADPHYRPRFTGPIWERDAAYHNGTAWPWLLGPFAEAVMRAESFSAASRAEARRLLSPLLARVDGESIGQLPEVFDGEDTPDRPQRPGGCVAQAWSVAETLRVWRLAAAGA